MQTHASVIELTIDSFDIKFLPSECRCVGTDVSHFFVDRLDIGQVRSIKRLIYSLPLVMEYRWVLVVATTIPAISQNALLKILEDTPDRTKIILVVPKISLLLPTVKSRLEILSSPQKICSDITRNENRELIECWLQDSIPQRLLKIADLDKKEALSKFLENVIDKLCLNRKKMSIAELKILNDVTYYASMPGASKKYLLEMLALTVPTIKI